MLNHLFIKDFAIVDSLDLELDQGMTALTGETGAGKSILLDALGLALGDRAAADAVRHGAERAEVSVAFDIAGMDEVADWLAGHDLADDGECLLRRVVKASGRSKGYINGRPVPLQMLRELGEQLVDIHGQHEHQSLMKRDIQRGILDTYADNGDRLARIGDLHARYRALQGRLRELDGGHEDTDARRDLLTYQFQELEAQALEPEAIAALDDEHRRLSNAGTLLQSTHQLLGMLYEDETSAQTILGQARRTLEEQVGNDRVFAEVGEMIDQALLQLDEGVDTLRRHVDDLDLDPSRLQSLEERIAALNALARKHRVRPEELLSIREQMKIELYSIDNASEMMEETRRELAETEGRYRAAAQALREHRRAAAADLSEQVTAVLQELGMEGAAFEISVEPLEDDAEPTTHGLDRISFDVRTNSGQPFGPLSRIASGGELSRISLAIQVVAADSTSIPTLVFDEADVGIGGGVAEVVGRLLRRLGGSHQVLCVTHLPQVASQAHQHLQVSKRSADQYTAATVARLDPEARVREIARMLGGVEITAATLSHAEEMVSRASHA